jgi:predicted Zn-dependent protease
MLHRLKRNNFIIFLCLLFLLSGCVTIYNPATQRKETLLIDTKAEVELGTGMQKDIENQLEILRDNPQMQYRLDDVGQRVANFSDRKDLDYHFKIVKEKELNAFAIPGGFIYVNSGLMDTATNDELAGVLAHEIGHIAARHSVKRLQAVLGYQIIMGIALGISGNQNIGQATDVIFNLVNLGYSRKDELLADRLAVKYSRKAGFNPRAMLTFFDKLKKEAEKQGPNFNLVFLSSHPPLEQRIKNIEDEIALNP